MVTPENRSQNERVSSRDPMVSPGTQLRQAREAIGATLAVVSARTRISETTLYHLENDMFDEFAVELFLKGHLRSYARELGLQPEEIIRSYERFVGVSPDIIPSDSISDPLDSTAELIPTHDNLPAAQQELLRRSQERSLERSQERAFAISSSIRNSSSNKRLSSVEPQVSPAAISGKHRKVIGRFDSQELRSYVRRGPHASDAGRNSAIRLSKPIFSIADRIFNNNTTDIPEGLSTAEASAPIIRQRIHGTPFLGETSQNAVLQLRRSTPSFRSENSNLPQKSKIERVIPQLKQFGAKHYIAIIVVIVLSVITAGLLSGNRATAQDPAKFPKNSQDSWELERQAEQTRWLLEQPDGQVDQSKSNDRLNDQ